MWTLIHGLNPEASRAKLGELKTHSSKTAEIHEFDLKKGGFAAIENLSSESLFSPKIILVIENFLANPNWTKKVVDLAHFDVVFWEGKKLTAGQLAIFKNVAPKISVLEFKEQSAKFAFLDSLAPGGQKDFLTLWISCKKEEAPESLFLLIVRQVRLLLMAHLALFDDKIAPWQKAKLEVQARKFTYRELRTCYRDLLQIDYRTKTGQSPINLETELEVFLTTF